jgi:hypothetical protein
MVSSKKKWTVMNPIRRPMKKRNPSSGQNGQLVHWWVLIHSGHDIWAYGSLHNGSSLHDRFKPALGSSLNFLRTAGFSSLNIPELKNY